jgi:ATP-dependent DNA helicase RecG
MRGNPHFSMTTLDTSIESLPGVGKSLSAGFRRLDIATVRDLLFHFPRRYLDLSVFSDIKTVQAGQTVTVRGFIKSIHARPSFRGRVSLCEAVVSDETGSIKIVWFNQPYLAKQLRPGNEIILSGKTEFYKTLQLQNPIYEKISGEGGEPTHTGRIVPVYSLTEGLYNRTLQKLVKQHLGLADQLQDIIPGDILRKYGLPRLPMAIRQLHFPESMEDVERARQRIIFEEVFIQQLAVQTHKRLLLEIPAPPIPVDIELIKQFLATLPFELTMGQKKALWQIVQDMEKKRAMNRLLEGDVGSGKTLVALIAILNALHSGFQCVLLAPTEILARQHYETFRRDLQGHPKVTGRINIALLTGQFREINGKEISKQHVLEAIKNGEVNILIGTHAVLQEAVRFRKLGLIVIDEQHRFGVEQRAMLLKKRTPHLLSMSATPIPRTLALAVYGDLDISALTELPKGRQKIATKIVNEDGRRQAYDFIRNQIKQGRQAFIITPRVEESETSAVKSVKKEFERLSKEIFPEFKLGLLYGKLKGAEKDKVMEQFNQGKIDILATTSVIEIGIDVPNATVMLIEGAERFGLAQLHQLRGRVGRGAHQSRCFLFLTDETSESIDRLEEFARSNDGFHLAEMDLKQRGFGSLFGTEQTGFDFRYPQFLTIKVLKMAREAAEQLIKNQPDLGGFPELKKQVEPLIEKIHLE